jgi:hypothetical protein
VLSLPDDPPTAAAHEADAAQTAEPAANPLPRRSRD